MDEVTISTKSYVQSVINGSFESFADLIARANRLEKFIKDQGDWNLYKLTVKDAEND